MHDPSLHLLHCCCRVQHGSYKLLSCIMHSLCAGLKKLLSCIMHCCCCEGEQVFFNTHGCFQASYGLLCSIACIVHARCCECMQVFSNSDGCLPADCFAARPASWMIGTASVSKIFFNSDGCLQASFRLLRKQEFVFTCMCRFLMHAVPRNLRDRFLETKTCVWRICLPSWFCPCRPSWPIVTVQVLASTSVCAYALAGLPRLFLLCRCSPAHLFVLPSLQAFLRPILAVQLQPSQDSRMYPHFCHASPAAEHSSQYFSCLAASHDPVLWKHGRCNRKEGLA